MGYGSEASGIPTPVEEPVKKKRKRADAAQLKVLNETYQRTAFPSTEERQALAVELDMPPRSVQIWFVIRRFPTECFISQLTRDFISQQVPKQEAIRSSEQSPTCSCCNLLVCTAAIRGPIYGRYPSRWLR